MGFWRVTWKIWLSSRTTKGSCTSRSGSTWRTGTPAQASTPSPSHRTNWIILPPAHLMTVSSAAWAGSLTSLSTTGEGEARSPGKQVFRVKGLSGEEREGQVLSWQHCPDLHVLRATWCCSVLCLPYSYGHVPVRMCVPLLSD